MFLTAAFVAAVTPTHRSTVANILIYLAFALATAAVIALVGGSSRKAKGEEAREKQRQEEEQEIEDYDKKQSRKPPIIGGFLMLYGGANCCLRGIKQGKLWGKGALFAGDGE